MRQITLSSILFVLLCVLIIIATGVGSSWISPSRVFNALIGHGSTIDNVIVWNLRLPRICLAVLSGAALSMSGLILQDILRNNIASPSVLGVISGSCVGVLTFFSLFTDNTNVLTVSITYQPLAAFLGAGIFVGVLLSIAGKHVFQPQKFILYAIGLAAIAKSFILISIILMMQSTYQVSTILTWLSGSIHGAQWQEVICLSIILAVTSVIIIPMGHYLRQIVLDDVTAASTGVAIKWVKGYLFVVCIIFSASAVAFVGGISFVGLVAPNIARILVGLNVRVLLVITPLIGAILVLGADAFSRAVAMPNELPTGAVIAMLGSLYFIYLIVRQARYG